MIVANEGEGFQKLKVWLITQFKKFLDWAEGAVKKNEIRKQNESEIIRDYHAS